MVFLQNYIEMNATGFRKILKKWDKRSKSTTKELYLARQVDVQPCFNRDVISELSDTASANVRKLEGLCIAKGGEQVLSRDAKDLATKLNAHAYVTGTVSKMQGRYFFNARLIQVKDSKVLAAYDVCLTGKVREAGL